MRRAIYNRRRLLKDIWDKLFFTTLSKFSKKKYFYSYPAFDKVIPSRGKKYIK